MNKVTEIDNKRIEAIRSEIRRMLDDKDKEDRFYRLKSYIADTYRYRHYVILLLPWIVSYIIFHLM